MVKTLMIEYEIFEEERITVLSVVDSEKDIVLKMFNGVEAEELYKTLTEDTDNKKQREFNQAECDWRYNAACTADAYCAEDCNMKCPYKKEEQ
ncbi:MAG: hypothetical protein PUC73_12625 [Lachnospiraceae bacterium]|nr:hypothetical protein [Lachnospiraceae bacterium]